MPKIIFVLRIMRNLFVSVISAIWILPLWMSAKEALNYLAWFERNWVDEQLKVSNRLLDEYPCLISISPFTVSEYYLTIGMIGLFIVIVTCAFVAANKLWPIRNSKEPDNQKDDPKKKENTL